MVVGLWNSNRYPKILKVEFSSQTGFTYDFYGSDFREEGDAILELAYALTIHKVRIPTKAATYSNLIAATIPI